MIIVWHLLQLGDTLVGKPSPIRFEGVPRNLHRVVQAHDVILQAAFRRC